MSDFSVYHDTDDDEPWLFPVETFSPEECGWVRKELTNKREIVYETPDGTFHIWPISATPRVTKFKV